MSAPDEGIHRLSIPTPFAVGRVNCYLVDDDPLTLVDTGPNSGDALDELELALAGHGRRIEDLERVVITHQHIDHLGLVDIIARRSGAEICALDVLAPVIEDFGADAERDDELAERLMMRHGVPRDVVTALRAVSRSFRSWGGSTEVEDPEAKMRELEERYADGRVTKLDGISVDYDDWHFNVRPSNTEPLLRLNLESVASREEMEQRRDEVLELIRS